MDINRIWKSIAGKSKTDSVDVVAKRFRQVFREHGVEPTQIPRLIPTVTLDLLRSDHALLTALSPKILDQVARLFGIRNEWLEGVDEEVYEYLACYKHPAILLDHLAEVSNSGSILNSPLRVLCTSKHLDFRDDSQLHLVPVLVEKIADLGENEVYRYHVYRDGFEWGYAATRIELKALARIAYTRLHITVPLFVVSAAVMEDVLVGKVVPWRYLNGCLISNPSLEDFALTKDESGIAKEVEELPEVLRYIEEHGLGDFSFERPEFHKSPTDSSEASDSAASREPQQQPTKPGKRAQAQSEIWEPIRNAARTLWAENNQLAIADVVRRIKGMVVFKGSSLSESAIRKRIADLAPPDIRGKPGRKAKQSS